MQDGVAEDAGGEAPREKKGLETKCLGTGSQGGCV